LFLNSEVNQEKSKSSKWRKIPRMVPQELLDILVCPVCKKPLIQKETGESLKCGECHRVYPVRDGIPILLVDEAVIEAA
jgi:uncharacterized protein YbaR (Trm112 family)